MEPHTLDGVSAEVAVIEPTGAETQINAKLGSDPLVATVRDRLSLKAGETVRMMPDLSKLHLFDAKTEKRLSIG